MQPDQAVINGWSGAAPFWEKHRETIRVGNMEALISPVLEISISELP